MRATARYKPRSPLALMLLGAAALLLAGSARATIINPDFSSGFDGWQATLDFNPAAPSPPEFTLPAGGGLARLTTSVDFFDVALFQTFTMDADAGTLSMDFDWSITDPFDFVQISLRDIVTNMDFDLLVLGGFDPTQLTGAGRLEVDVSALAGRQVELLAFVQDFDFGDDMLTFCNIAVASAPVTTPAPASLPLVALAMLLLGVRGVRRRR
jgi:hypothetical protein